jgi:predicted permease
MARLRQLLNLLPWRRRRLERDLDRELRYHLDRRVDDLRRAGVSEADARRWAAHELGGIDRVQEEVRETWSWRGPDRLMRDVRYASRALARRPGFTATAVLSLALGIGANAAIFSLVDQLLLRPLPVPEAERLVHFGWRGSALANSWGGGNLLSYPLCRDLDEQRQLFDGAFCRYPTTVALSAGQRHDPEPAEVVSGSYFPVLGVRPALGRFIDRSDDVQPGTHPVVVLSHAYWKNELGGAPDVVGRTVRVNNHPMTVIGVAPASFRGVDPGEGPALWIPAAMKRQATPEWDALLDRRAVWMHVFARLKPGVSVERAKAGLRPWFRATLDAETRLADFPTVSAEHRRAFLASTLDVLPAPRGVSSLRGTLERPLWVLLAGTSLLLALACLNVAGLLLARGAARGRELATRMALGASRGRITGQVLAESAIITLGGVLLGLVTAPAVARALVSFLSPEADLGFRVDRRVFLFAVLVAAVTAGLCALAPVVQTGRLSLIASLRERSRVAGGVRLRKALVVGQLAFTLVLLVGAGLFARTLARLHENVGFSSDRLVMFGVTPPAVGYSDPDARRLMRDLSRKLQEVPGVEAVAAANTSLLAGGSFSRTLTIPVDGRAVVTDRPVYGLRVTPGFFSALGIRLIAGRDFDERDTRDARSGTPGFRAAIVNRSFARRYFGDRPPLGRRVGIGNQPDTPATIEIVGVIEDFSYRSLRLKESEHVFFPFWDRQAEDGVFYLRVRGTPEAAFASIRAAVGELAPTLPVPALRTFDDQIDRSLATERMLATLSSGFGVVALLLSVVGLYGVLSFVVTHRTREIGVRRALGATRAGAVWLVVRDTLVMIGAGAAIAFPCLWALGRLVEAHLFGVRAFDGPTVAVASGLLALVALGAAMLPGWRAAAVNPTEALRFE